MSGVASVHDPAASYSSGMGHVDSVEFFHGLLVDRELCGCEYNRLGSTSVCLVQKPVAAC